MISVAILACAPSVAPATIEAVIAVESGGNPFAININKGPRVAAPRTAEEAARTVRWAIAQGYSVDIGLMQVNSRNLSALGVTIEQMFEPCANVRAGGTILAANYARAVQARGEGQAALLAALSAYNTGDFARGFRNGYVSQYFGTRRTSYRVGRVPGPTGAGLPNPFTSPSTIYVRKETANVAESNGRPTLSDSSPIP